MNKFYKKLEVIVINLIVILAMQVILGQDHQMLFCLLDDATVIIIHHTLTRLIEVLNVMNVKDMGTFKQNVQPI